MKYFYFEKVCCKSKTSVLETIINQFKINIDPNDKLFLVESIPKLANIIGNKGEISESDLDHAKLPSTTIKDHLSLSYRRTVF